MDTEVFRFKVGDFECFSVSDGTYIYKPPEIPPPATMFFANAPKKLLDQVLRKHQIKPEEWLTFKDPFICVVINTGRHKVLVDTGVGDPTLNTGRLVHNLQEIGIGTDEIDMVVLTHGHEDHVGGNTSAQGKPTFTKAHYVILKKEWIFWTSKEAEKHYENPELELIRKNLFLIQSQLTTIEHETVIAPGIRVMPTPGHTFGSISVAISSNGKQLLCVSDVFIHPIHIEHPEWHTTFDMTPEQLIKTRRILLNKIAAEKALMLATHFPFPGVGYVVKKGTGWQWQPI